MHKSLKTTKEKGNRAFIIGLCIGGLVINFLGVRLALGLRLPLYLDNIGGALTAALGGFIPGIIVGFFTNLINGISDYTTAYYGSLTVLIAISAAYFAKKGYFSRWSRLPIIIITFALIGGGLGSLLTWTLYGFDFGTGISAPLAHRIYASGIMNQFWSQFAADMLIDLVDKTITVLIVALILRVMPESLKAKFYFSWWQQAPLTDQSQSEINTRRVRRVSLRAKIVVLVITACLILAVFITAISFSHFRDAAIEEKEEIASSVAHVAKEYINGDHVKDYLERGEAAEGYLETKQLLSTLMDSSESIEFVYAYRIEEDGCHVVFDPDTEDTPGEAPGTIIPFDMAFEDQIPALLAGKEIEPVISDETYGWLLTLYEPVYDSNGVCQCYAAADVNMDSIRIKGYQFLSRVISLFVGFFIMLLTVVIWMAEYSIILPINSMATATGNFAFERRKDSVQSIKTVEDLKILNISTGDEIENLYHAVVKTTEDMAEYIAYVQKQSAEIGKLQNGLILVMADLVESRDKCTGDHVRKTAAYTDIIMRQMIKNGDYTDQLTDAFREDVENSAPLHDIGKIQVPDSILNKPGKLTPEEFEIMKTHTSAGSEIISKAMEMVSEDDSGYLKEARNLAHYHHEKWNGAGYPCGLKGEEIPLSARIMAVADVFDALVSRRSYKEGFPLEKAMDIIREGSGTHFDPKVAQAFIDAEDEVRRVMNTYMGS